ncbi:PREDICTED: uncharacterized protein LOC109217629 [Nicotiana attenuata]|uniref:uncharacterized protein LOC109217629 n=1 Tax=Nicotiana attenuata TaxID=49451 RepID=UPI00090545DE|nr:PREDICTED: uncharacterized protein LOC109217629 [Nicotiana attenuata]
MSGSVNIVENDDLENHGEDSVAVPIVGAPPRNPENAPGPTPADAVSRDAQQIDETSRTDKSIQQEEGVVLGHRVLRSGIEVDKAKVEVVEKLPPPISMMDVRSFLGHAGFYRFFIKDFSKIVTPLCRLLEKDVFFNFDEACLKAFEELKKKLVSAPIIATSDWSLLFELICDASDHAIGAVLG